MANPLNQLFQWLPMKGDELHVKQMPIGYEFNNKGIVQRSDLTKPVYRYAKNYFVADKKYSLCFITHESDLKKVEEWLDRQAVNVKEDSIQSMFSPLGVSYE